jgi:hypothetical protein
MPNSLKPCGNGIPQTFRAGLMRISIGAILPRLSGFTVKKIRVAIDVSHPYATLIKHGLKIPHPRHWVKLAELTRYHR